MHCCLNDRYAPQFLPFEGDRTTSESGRSPKVTGDVGLA